jgi:transposase
MDEQEYCIDCSDHLRVPLRRAHCRRCDSCRERARNALHSIPPPSRPASPPPPVTLFNRDPSSFQHLSEVERAAAVTLLRVGETQRKVAEQLNCSRQTVAKWKRTYEQTGQVHEADRSGRPRETTEQENINIVTSAVVNTHSKPREILQELNLIASARTVDRRLQQADLFGRVAQRKRVFTEEDKRKRLSFAEGYKHWKKEDWERVLFADEAIIQGEGGTKGGREWVRRPKGIDEAFKTEYLGHKLPHPKQLNIWACFSASGLGYCYIYNDNLDAKSFVCILDTHLLASADLVFTESPRLQWYLLQDNAPTHKARITRK